MGWVFVAIRNGKIIVAQRYLRLITLCYFKLHPFLKYLGNLLMTLSGGLEALTLNWTRTFAITVWKVNENGVLNSLKLLYFIRFAFYTILLYLFSTWWITLVQTRYRVRIFREVSAVLANIVVQDILVFGVLGRIRNLETLQQILLMEPSKRSQIVIGLITFLDWLLASRTSFGQLVCGAAFSWDVFFFHRINRFSTAEYMRNGQTNIGSHVWCIRPIWCHSLAFLGVFIITAK